jgi:hypothetical protein
VIAAPDERQEERAFLVQLAVILGLAVLLPWIAWSVLPHDGLLRYVPVGLAAALLVASSIRFPAAGLFAFALFVLFYDTLARHLGEPIRRVDEVAIAGLGLVAAFRLLPRWRDWFWWPRELAIVLLLLAGVASSLLGGVPIRIWGTTLLLVFKGLAFFYVALSVEPRPAQLRGGLKVLLGMGVVLVATSFIELVDPISFQHAIGLNEYLRIRGPLYVVKSVFVHPVLFAWFTALVALLAYAAYSVTHKRRFLLIGGFLSLGPFLGARRRAILALLAALGVAFGASWWRTRALAAVARRWAPVGATMAIILVVFIPALSALWDSTVVNYITPSPNPTASGDGFGEGDGEAPPQVRIALYVGAAEIARDNFPLGAGLGRWGSWMSREYYSPLYFEYDVARIRGLRPHDPRNVTDTFWPQILGETGAVGLVAYAGWLAAIGLVLLRSLRRQMGGALRIFLLGATMIWVQAGIESLASPMYHSPPRAYLTFLILGTATAVAWRMRREQGQPTADAG